MRQVFKFDSNGFYLEPVILQDNEEMPNDCTEIQPQDGLYKAQFVNGEWIEVRPQVDILNDLKASKKIELDLKYEYTLSMGFPSSALGESHNYPCDIEAMIYFNATINRFDNDQNFTSINQKTLDSGFLPHTKEQFIQVFNDGHSFGIAQDTKLNQLKNDVDLATTPDQLNNISWE